MHRRLAVAVVVSASVLGLVATAVAHPRFDKPRKKPAKVQAGRVLPRGPNDFPSPEPLRPLAERLTAAREESMRYKGIDVKLQAGIDGATWSVQSAAARLLERLDYVPAHRVDTYRWLTDSGRYTISAWHAVILGSRQVQAGTILEVRVWAEFGNSGLGTAVHTIETYLSTPDGRIDHLDSVAPKASKVTSVN